MMNYSESACSRRDYRISGYFDAKRHVLSLLARFCGFDINLSKTDCVIEYQNSMDIEVLTATIFEQNFDNDENQNHIKTIKSRIRSSRDKKYNKQLNETRIRFYK